MKLVMVGLNLVTTTPVFLTRQVNDLDNPDVTMKEVIAFTQYGPRTFQIEPAELFDAGRIVKGLSRFGVSVGSATARTFAKFLLRHSDHKPLSLSNQTNRLGCRTIGKDKIYLLDRTYPERQDLIFHAQNDIDRKRQAATQPHGELQEWGKVLAKILPYPKVVVGVLAGLAPAVRELLDLDEISSFIVHFYAPSTTGKSISQKIAVSIWANPESGEWFHHGHATFAGIEKLCLATFGLPVFFEDLHKMRFEDQSPLIYAIGNEQFKARGGKQAQAQLPWHGVFISSGELPLIVPDSLPGEAARVIQLNGAPFGGQSEKLSSLISTEILPGIRSNYALVGPSFVETLLALPEEERQELRTIYKREKDKWEKIAGSHVLMARQAPQWAAMEIVTKFLGFLFAPDVAVQAVKALEISFKECESEPIPDPVTKARTLLVGYAFANEDRLYTRENKVIKAPSQKGHNVGVLDRDEKIVALYPHFADDILRRAGYVNPTQVFQALKDRGVLKCNPGRLQYRMRVEKDNRWMYALALEEEELSIEEHVFSETTQNQ